MAETHHETVHFTGHVQGVGFRFTTRQVAKEYEVAGYVKNLADGRVLLEVEGTAAEVAAFVAAVEERMHGCIRKVERTSERRAPRFSGFSIL
ncbi:MAG: acylphosphatase [Verrucomicrobia bacterium]|nr:acylphosphatase [Verrucomicrobiota bacterium]